MIKKTIALGLLGFMFGCGKNYNPVQQNYKPDLAVTDVNFKDPHKVCINDVCLPGTYYDVWGKIENQGEGSIDKYYCTDAKVNEISVGDFCWTQYPEPGRYVLYKFGEATFKQGTNLIKVKTDTGNTLEEENENNNKKILEVNCGCQKTNCSLDELVCQKVVK